jgi:hypothetical protein
VKPEFLDCGKCPWNVEQIHSEISHFQGEDNELTPELLRRALERMKNMKPDMEANTRWFLEWERRAKKALDQEER